MPKEHKKRGRREEQKKRKREHNSEHDERDAASKRRRSHVDDSTEVEGAVPFRDEAIDDVSRPGATPFFGNLEEDEQEYFKRADEMLELNQFDGPDERDLFLESVWKEADGKELKLANSQSCSRLMERLILLSKPRQLKNLFRKFNDSFVHLVQHRFASHCCETLFIRAAPFVTEEHSKPETPQTPPSSDPTQESMSMENCFLFALDQFESYLGFLMTDRFASHILRVLLIILSGAPLEKENKSAVHSKRKEKVGVSGADNTQELVLSKRKVPTSFLVALEKVIGDISDGLDSAQLRLLATHPTGNPTLQLMLKLELAQFGKSRAKNEKSVIHKLLPDDPIVEGTESASFVNGLVYDSIGSRLLETIIENAPGKLFKSLYSEFFRDRMGSLARNEIASYVAAKVLERLGKDDLEEAKHQIVEQIPGLVERNRTAIIKTLIERCAVRGVETAPIRAQLEKAYSGPSGFEITRMLKPAEAPSDDGKANNKHEHNPDKTHGSLLAQAMMSVPGALGNLIFDAFVNLSVPVTLRIARDPTASRTLQAALTSPNATVIFRRKVIQQFYGKVGELALDPAGSHVIDAIWEGTHGLAFIRERIAEELSENEAALRESHVGRAVWRNWRMDLYKRRRADWVKQSRYAAGNEGFQSFPESNGAPQAPSQRATKHMTAIELARRRHAEAKAAQAKKESTSSKKDSKKSYTSSEGGSDRKGKGKAHVAAH